MSNAEVPGKFQVSVAGRSFMIDNMDEFSGPTSVPLQRQQFDSQGRPGEGTLNSEDVWRRVAQSWHHGAGQSVYDANDSDEYRFSDSRRVDVWTRNELSLLPTVDLQIATDSILEMIVANDRVYVRQASEVKFTDDLGTWTSLTGGPVGTPTSLATDGFHVWSAHGSDRIYQTQTNNTAMTQLVNSGASVDLVAYMRGRLMAAYGPNLYNITSAVAAALPTALFTSPNTGFAFNCFGEGPSHIYAGGFSGDKSLIYRTTVSDDGTTMEVPVVAARLPDGELIRSLYGYLGYVFIGTDLGIRVAQPQDNGDLVLGALIPTFAEVRCFEGQDRFVWAGTKIDGTTNGLVRLDLSVFTQPLTPAYANDLEVTHPDIAQGVFGVGTFENKRIFAVIADHAASSGLYFQSADLMADGWVEPGEITYGIPDQKAFHRLEVRSEPLAGSLTPSMVWDRGTLAVLDDAFVTADEVLEPFDGASEGWNGYQASRFNPHLVLTRDTEASLGPVVLSITLKVRPTPARSFQWIVPLRMSEVLKPLNGTTSSRDPDADLTFLQNLLVAGPVTCEVLGRTFEAFVEEVAHRPKKMTTQRTWWNGSALIKLKQVP